MDKALITKILIIREVSFSVIVILKQMTDKQTKLDFVYLRII